MTSLISQLASRSRRFRAWARSAPVVELALLSGVAGFLILNRLIPAPATVPIGLSIHPSEALLVALAVFTVAHVATRPDERRLGVVGAAGLVLVALVTWAPLVNSGTLGPQEIRLFDQGIFLALGYTTLFVAVFRATSNPQVTLALIIITVAVSDLQALIAIYERVANTSFEALNRLWLSLGLELDPRGIRDTLTNVNTRLTGEFRATSTAPHPLALSATMAVSSFVSLQMLRTARTRAARLAWSGSSALAVLGLTATNSRTGMLVLAVCALLFVLLNADRPLLLVHIGIWAMAVFSVLVIIAPETFRIALDLFTGQRDHNIQVRIDRVPVVLQFLEDRPLLGAGYLTNDAVTRQLWDNAYLHSLSELGLLGTAATVVFFASATWRPITARIYGRSTEGPLLVGAYGGAALLVGGMAFDAWTFDQFLPLCIALLAIGCGTAVLDADSASTERLGAAPAA